MTFYPIWEGVYPYKDVKAKILLANAWKALLLENDESFPPEELFEKCSFEEWKRRQRQWGGFERRAPIPLWGKPFDHDTKRHLIYPTILPIKRDSGSIEDCTVGFNVAVQDRRNGNVGHSVFFVKVEGSEKL